MHTFIKFAGINPLATRGLGCTGVKRKGVDESIENETLLNWLVEVFGIGVTEKFSCSIKLDVVGESLVDDGPGADGNTAVLVDISFSILIVLGLNGCVPVNLNPLIIIFIFRDASNSSQKLLKNLCY